MNSSKENSSRAKHSVALKSGIMGAINQFTLFCFCLSEGELWNVHALDFTTRISRKI